MKEKAIILGVLGAPIFGYLWWADREGDRLLLAFDQTVVGEPLSSVTARFGKPSHVERHADVPGYDSGSRSACGETCWLRYWYEIPLTLGTAPVTVDFDRKGRVIHKYQWHSP